MLVQENRIGTFKNLALSFLWYIAWYKKQGQQSLKRPAIDDRRPTPNPTNKLFQQTLNKQFDSPLLPDRYPIVYPFPGVTGFSAFAPDISAHSVPSAPDSVQSFWPEALRLGELSD